MIPAIPDLWFWFIVCFAIMLITNYFMGRAAQHFYLQSMTRIKFSIFDLEFPAWPDSLPTLFNNIDKLRGRESKKVRRALRANLLLDFIFMPATYIGIYLLCMHTAMKMRYVGRDIFAVLAWMQLAAWLFDIIENVYLLGKMSTPTPSSMFVHKAFVRMVTAKWVLATTGAVCSVFGTLYFWLNGFYLKSSLVYLGIIVALIALFVVIQIITGKRSIDPPLTETHMPDPQPN